jgi:hypothetical protein
MCAYMADFEKTCSLLFKVLHMHAFIPKYKFGNDFFFKKKAKKEGNKVTITAKFADGKRGRRQCQRQPKNHGLLCCFYSMVIKQMKLVLGAVFFL